MKASEEAALYKAIRAARVVQTFLWGESNGKWGFEEWKRMFRKRIAKLDTIKADNPHAVVEVKKRLLQTAALSIALIAILDETKKLPEKDVDAPPSNLPDFDEIVKEG